MTDTHPHIVKLSGIELGTGLLCLWSGGSTIGCTIALASSALSEKEFCRSIFTRSCNTTNNNNNNNNNKINDYREATVASATVPRGWAAFPGVLAAAQWHAPADQRTAAPP